MLKSCYNFRHCFPIFGDFWGRKTCPSNRNGRKHIRPMISFFKKFSFVYRFLRPTSVALQVPPFTEETCTQGAVNFFTRLFAHLFFGVCGWRHPEAWMEGREEEVVSQLALSSFLRASIDFHHTRSLPASPERVDEHGQLLALLHLAESTRLRAQLYAITAPGERSELHGRLHGLERQVGLNRSNIATNTANLAINTAAIASQASKLRAVISSSGRHHGHSRHSHRDGQSSSQHSHRDGHSSSQHREQQFQPFQQQRQQPRRERANSGQAEVQPMAMAYIADRDKATGTQARGDKVTDAQRQEAIKEEESESMVEGSLIEEVVVVEQARQRGHRGGNDPASSTGNDDHNDNNSNKENNNSSSNYNSNSYKTYSWDKVGTGALSERDSLIPIEDILQQQLSRPGPQAELLGKPLRINPELGDDRYQANAKAAAARARTDSLVPSTSRSPQQARDGTGRPRHNTIDNGLVQDERQQIGTDASALQGRDVTFADISRLPDHDLRNIRAQQQQPGAAELAQRAEDNQNYNSNKDNNDNNSNINNNNENDSSNINKIISDNNNNNNFHQHHDSSSSSDNAFDNPDKEHFKEDKNNQNQNHVDDDESDSDKTSTPKGLETARSMSLLLPVPRPAESGAPPALPPRRTPKHGGQRDGHGRPPIIYPPPPSPQAVEKNSKAEGEAEDRSPQPPADQPLSPSLVVQPLSPSRPAESPLSPSRRLYIPPFSPSRMAEQQPLSPSSRGGSISERLFALRRHGSGEHSPPSLITRSIHPVSPRSAEESSPANVNNNAVGKKRYYMSPSSFSSSSPPPPPPCSSSSSSPPPLPSSSSSPPSPPPSSSSSPPPPSPPPSSS
eukprot:g79524.t1